MKVTRKSPLTGIEETRELDITEDQMERYCQRMGLIQDIFPNLSPGDREFIQTGYTEEDWAKIFSPEEGDDNG